MDGLVRRKRRILQRAEQSLPVGKRPYEIGAGQLFHQEARLFPPAAVRTHRKRRIQPKNGDGASLHREREYGEPEIEMQFFERRGIPYPSEHERLIASGKGDVRLAPPEPGQAPHIKIRLVPEKGQQSKAPTQRLLKHFGVRVERVEKGSGVPGNGLLETLGDDQRL